MSDFSVAAFRPQSVTVVQDGASRVTTPQKAEKSGFSFGDLVDTLNPLHHIPIVGQIYRAVTGDAISDKARLAGGGLFAGPLGIGIAAATISMRDGQKGTGDENLVPQSVTPPKQRPMDTAPVTTAIDENMAGYTDIAKAYWTRSSLNPLLGTLNVKASSDDDGQHQAQSDVMTSTQAPPAPVGSVSAPKTLEPPQPNAAYLAQMLANLEKYEALAADAR